MTRSRRGRGEGSVHQRTSDGRWVGSASLGYGPDGKRRRATVYGRTKKEAQEKLRAVLARHDQGTLPERGGSTVAGWLDHWLKVVAASVEPATLDPYERHVRIYIRPRPIASIELTKVRVADVEAFYASMLADGTSAAMVRKVGVTLGVAFNHAVRSGRLTANPVAAAKKPKAERPKIVVLNPDQLRTFVSDCRSNRLGDMFLFLLDTGCRPGEALALLWPDIDLDSRTVTITKSLEEIRGRLRVKVPKTKGSVRRIDFSAETAEALVRHRAAMADEGHDDGAIVFPNVEGGYLRVGAVNRYWYKPLLRAAGLPPIRLYDLRHTCATLLLSQGVSPKVVAERLGHATVAMTLNTYSHVTPTMQKAAASVLGAAIYGTGPK